mmetsp:Transcript_48933/g.122282  ORF Transcript_48933/g.122282 Transcript_48933/m.122282 type:complete len:354 (+) Transcript_48933:383-1444(+)
MLEVDPVHLVQHFLGEGPLEGCDILLELLHRGGTDDDAPHVLPGSGPSVGEVYPREAVLLGESEVVVGGIHGAFRVVPALKLRVEGVPCLGCVTLVLVLARKSASRQNPVGEEGDSIVDSARLGGARLCGAVLLKPPVHEGKVVLDAHRGGDPKPLGGLEKLDNTDSVLVRDAPVLDLASLDQLADRADALVEGDVVLVVVGALKLEGPKGRRVPLGPVQLVEVEVFGLEPLERGVARLEDLVARQPRVLVLAWGDLPVGDNPPAGAAPRDLGGEEDLGARRGVRLQPVADVDLGAPHGLARGGDGVELRCVDEGVLDARLEDIVVELGVGLELGVLISPCHGSEAAHRDEDA